MQFYPEYGSLKVVLNLSKDIAQKGVVHFLVLFLLLAGIIGGVLLITRGEPLKLLPRAFENHEQTKPTQKGYIVEFKDDSLVDHLKALNKLEDQSFDQGLINDYQSSLLTQHLNYKFQLQNKLNKTPLVGNGSLTVLKEYTNIMNGVALDISSSEAEQIKQLSFVKAVYPNYEVSTTDQQSAAMIGAPRVWEPPLTMKNILPNITGAGKTIAIIDTGVDLTHPDLGNSKITDLNYEYITDPLTFRIPTNGIIALDNNRLIYPVNKQIKIYSFDTKNEESFDLFSGDLKVLKIAVKDNLIAYYAADSRDNAGVYFYNLETKVHKKIADFSSAGALSVTGDKIVYSRDSKTYVYNTKTNQEKSFGSPVKFGYFDSYMSIASGNLAVTSLPKFDEGICFSKLIVYNLDTESKQEFTPPDLGGILDFKDKKILYFACNEQLVTDKFITYYLYDLDTNEATKISIEGNGLDAPSLNDLQIQKFNSFTIHGYGPQGGIGGDVLFLSQGFDRNQKIKAYDLKNNNVSLINPIKNSYALAVEGNRACFVASDTRVYCSIYDSDNLYKQSPQIFNSKVVGGYNFVDNNNLPLDDMGHGTHVASIAAGKGSINGIAYDAKVVSYKVLNSNGHGFTSDMIAAVNTATYTRYDSDPFNNIDVINMSLGINCKAITGGYTEDCGPDDILSQVVDRAVDSGIVVVVSAGNDGELGEGSIGSPGTARKAITVGAVDKNKQIADFSSKGPVIWKGEDINKPDIVAPGVDICASEWGDVLASRRCIDNNHIALDGTSMAAPHIAGVAALLKQVYPKLTPLQIKEVLLKTAQNLGFDKNSQGAGLVDVYSAVNSFIKPIPQLPSPQVTPNPTPPETASPNSFKNFIQN